MRQARHGQECKRGEAAEEGGRAGGDDEDEDDGRSCLDCDGMICQVTEAGDAGAGAVSSVWAQQLGSIVGVRRTLEHIGSDGGVSVGEGKHQISVDSGRDLRLDCVQPCTASCQSARLLSR